MTAKILGRGASLVLVIWGYTPWATALGVQIDGFSGGESAMKTILLQNGPCGGERWNVSEYSRFHWRHSGGKHERYRHSGQVDAATGCPIFVYAPRRGRA